MTQPLAVDTTRLEQAAAALREVVLPTSPAPITTGGMDPVSAAVNETMPAIESPVSEGLPTAKTALSITASNLAAAAGMYAETDRTHGARLTQHDFSRSETGVTVLSGRAASTEGSVLQSGGSVRLVASDSAADAVDSAAEVAPQVNEAIGGVNQMVGSVNQMVGTVTSFTQGIVGNTQSQPLTDGSRNEEENTDTDENVDGAGAGTGDLERVPSTSGAAPADLSSRGVPL